MEITEHLPSRFSETPLFLPKSRSAPADVDVVAGLPGLLGRLPWRIAKTPAMMRMDGLFLRRLRQADARRTVSYLWPSPPATILDALDEAGVVSVREMINCFRGTAKRILDEAFRRAGMEPYHNVSASSVDEERVELGRYDYVFSSNAECDASLIEAGVAEDRILKTSFGWRKSRFQRHATVPKRPEFTVTFVGFIGIRKGVHCLLEAWHRAKLPGRLILIGDVEPKFQPILDRYRSDPTIEVVPFTDDIEKHYKSSHVFVFPTFEEGGPQVTYEAAGCGLPVIATPMGAGRLVVHERNGLIVPAGNVEALAEALVRMQGSSEERDHLGARGRDDAQRFTYDNLGRERAGLLRTALERGKRSRAH